MIGESHHGNLDDPISLAPSDALSMLQPIPAGELQFMDRYGVPVEHDRTLVSLPAGDELYAGKRAIVWSQEMRPTRLLSQTEAIVQPLFEDDKESETEGS